MQEIAHESRFEKRGPAPASMDAPWGAVDDAKYKALWVAEHLFGRRAAGARERVRRRQIASLADKKGVLLPFPRANATADPEEFVRTYLRNNQPVLFKGAAKDWPAVKKWSPAFFGERYGKDPIRLLHMAPDDAGKQRYDGVDTTLGDAVARLSEGNRAYIRFIPILNDYPELQADLDMKWLRARRGPLSPPGNMHLFMGGAGTETGTHAAISTNLFIQVHGKKRWKIYAPSWTPVFAPPMERAMYFSTSFDPDRPDYDRYPGARHLVGYEVELEPGDVMFVPPFWWHKVANPTVSIGVGFRWFPPGPCFRASPVQWLLTYMSINPPFWVGLQHKLDFTKIYTTRWRP